MTIAAGIIGGIKQTGAVKNATKAQTASADAATAETRRQYDTTRNDLAVYRDGGGVAQKAYDFEIGIGAKPENYGGYTKTPGYDFRMQEGMNALQASAAARGGLLSGAALRDSQKFGQDYGTNEYGNYLARLGGRADIGAQAATNTGNFGAQAATNIGNIGMAKGNAQAAGAIAQGNAWNGALTNALSGWNYQKSLGGGGGNQLFGGNSWG